MGKKGEYPEEYAKSARAALVRFTEDRGLTDIQAGKLLGVSSGTVSKVKTGVQNMQMGLALKLCGQLGMTLDELVHYRPDKPIKAAPPSIDADTLAAQIARNVAAQLLDSHVMKTPEGGREKKKR